MISNSTIGVFIGMILLGIILPVVVAVVWLRKTKEPVVTILIGAGIFFVFAIVLETLPKLVLFQTTNPVGKYVMSNVFLYMTIAALLAGIFEETGRLVAFKFLLKKQTKKETAITYGIGHGGFEAMYLLVVGGIQDIVYAIMINAGQFESLVEQVRMTAPDQLETLLAIPASLTAITASTLVFAVMERISAMVIHVACSILMFKAVRGEKKMWLFPLAILLHASIDMVAAFYQMGLITSIFVVEICLMVWAAVFLFITVRNIYKKM